MTALALTIALLPSAYAQTVTNPRDKIQFDLETLSQSGLVDTARGQRSLRYEFCIPYDAAAITAVQAIDPTLILYLRSSGSVGCNTAEMLAVGHTQQPNFQAVLIQLATLDSIERIEPAWGE